MTVSSMLHAFCETLWFAFSFLAADAAAVAGVAVSGSRHIQITAGVCMCDVVCVSACIWCDNYAVAMCRLSSLNVESIVEQSERCCGAARQIESSQYNDQNDACSGRTREREREPTYHILLCMSSPHSYSPLSSSLKDLRAKNGKMKPSRWHPDCDAAVAAHFFLISIVNEGDCSWTFLHELTRLFASCLSFTFTFLRVCVLNSFHSFVCVSYVFRREPILLSQSHFVQNKRLEDDVAYILHVFVCVGTGVRALCCYRTVVFHYLSVQAGPSTLLHELIHSSTSTPPLNQHSKRNKNRKKESGRRGDAECTTWSKYLNCDCEKCGKTWTKTDRNPILRPTTLLTQFTKVMHRICRALSAPSRRRHSQLCIENCFQLIRLAFLNQLFHIGFHASVVSLTMRWWGEEGPLRGRDCEKASSFEWLLWLFLFILFVLTIKSLVCFRTRTQANTRMWFTIEPISREIFRSAPSIQRKCHTLNGRRSVYNTFASLFSIWRHDGMSSDFFFRFQSR